MLAVHAFSKRDGSIGSVEDELHSGIVESEARYLEQPFTAPSLRLEIAVRKVPGDTARIEGLLSSVTVPPARENLPEYVVARGHTRSRARLDEERTGNGLFGPCRRPSAIQIQDDSRPRQICGL